MSLRLSTAGACCEIGGEDFVKMRRACRLVIIWVLGIITLCCDHGRAEDTLEGSCAAGGIGCAAATSGTAVPDFFRSYGTAWVQAEMLQDQVRTRAFRDAILGNKNLFKGKVVLDVGAGTGLLSFFAAQAGAARVFAVERSDMALIARQIAVDSGLNGTVEVIHGLLEEISLPVPTVDIIVSEWIGTFLIHESMLDSVLFARDRWLAKDGLILPDSATLYLAGAEDQGSDFGQWHDFYGLNYSALSAASRQVAAQQCMYRQSLATEPAVLLDLDIYGMSVRDQEFDVAFRLPSAKASRTEGEAAREVAALAGWFTLGFFKVSRSCPRCTSANSSILTTHPDAPCTHWAQTMFFLNEALPLQIDGSLRGAIEVRRAAGSPRDLSIRLTLDGHDVNQSFTIVGADF